MVLQKAVPVVESKLWSLAQSFYSGCEAAAWAEGALPQGAAANACLADAYAGIVAAWLRDLGPQPAERQPLVLEIGAGRGSFAWLFMQRFLKRHWLPEDGEPAFTYLMADADEDLTQGWQREPRFGRLRQRGLLDFGHLAADAPTTIRCADATLTFASLRQRPVVVIANYLFETMPHDLYRVRKGQLERVLLALASDDAATLSGAPGSFETITPTYTGQAIAKAETGHPLLDTIVDAYAAMGRDMAIPVPRQGFDFLQPLVDREQPLLLLARDLAYTHPDRFPNKPPFVFGGSFSQYTNFHAIGELFRHHNGGVQFQRHPDPSFTVAAFWLPGQGRSASLAQTRTAARERLAEFAPGHTSELLNLLTENIGRAEYGQLFAWLHSACLDPQVAQTCVALFVENYHRSTDGLDPQTLRDVYLEAYEQHLPTGIDDRFDFEVAQLLLVLRFDADANALLSSSLAELGRSPERLYVYALSLLRLQQREQARAVLEEALAMRPDFAAARQAMEEHFSTAPAQQRTDEFPHITVSCKSPDVAERSKAMMLEHGVVWYKDMFPRAYIEQVRDAFMARFEDWKQDEMGKPNSVGNKRYTVPLRMNAPFSDPALFAPPVLMDLLREQMGEDPIICAYGGVITYPGANSQHVHREHPLLFSNDDTNVQLPLYAANLLIPLTDIDEQLGGTQVWEGTHRLRSDQTWQGPSKVIHARMGDAIALDYRTFHGGMQCVAGNLRPLLFISYSLPWFRDTLAFDLHDAVAVSPSERAAIPQPYRDFFRFARSIQDRQAVVQARATLVTA